LRTSALYEYEEARKAAEETSRRLNLLTQQKDILSNDVSHLANQRADIANQLE
jgi:hypothetical protein